MMTVLPVMERSGSDNERHVTMTELIRVWQQIGAPLAERKGLAFELTIDPSLPSHILIDPDRLHHVVVELILNAVRYTQAGSISLNVRWRGSAFVIDVRDTGIGIPTYLTTTLLFDSNTTRPMNMDSSSAPTVGLKTIRRIVQSLGGSLMIHSQIGSGTTFTVLLPLVSPAAVPTHS